MIPKTSKGKQKIEIRYLADKTKRRLTYYKRKKGLLKSANELQLLTGSVVLVVLVNENGTMASMSSNSLNSVLEETKAKIEKLLSLRAKAEQDSDPDPAEGSDSEQDLEKLLNIPPYESIFDYPLPG